MKIFMVLFLYFFHINLSFAQNLQNDSQKCRIKLVPEKNTLVLLGGYKTKWISIPSVEKYSTCIKLAEDKLTKANKAEKPGSFKNFLRPKYFKSIKVEYIDGDCHKYKTKIKFKRILKS